MRLALSAPTMANTAGGVAEHREPPSHVMIAPARTGDKTVGRPGRDLKDGQAATDRSNDIAATSPADEQHCSY